MYVAYDRPNRHEAFAQCWYSASPQSAALDRPCFGVGWTYVLFCCDDDGAYCSVDTTHWPSVDLMPSLNRHLACISCLLGDVGPTLYKCYTNVLCLLG